VPPVADATALVGRVLGGRYRLVRLIGQGGMGAVYEGVHVHLERRHAIKVLRGEHAHDAEWVARFHREALLTSKIASPHVVVISDVGVTDDGTRYAVMELLTGEDLGARLARGPLAISEALEIMHQVLAGVGAAHALGVVHRDLKPDNVFLGAGERGPIAKILDFGICKPVTSDGASPALTAAGLAVGTPLYMPPEQLLGQPVDARADVYAAAVVLYQLLAGQPPYVGATFTELAARHLTDDIPDVRVHRPEVPPTVAAALRQGMAKDANDRFQSAGAFALALGDGRPAPHAPRPGGVPSPREPGETAAAFAPTTVDARVPVRDRGRGAMLGAALAVGLGAAIVAGVAWQRSRAGRAEAPADAALPATAPAPLSATMPPAPPPPVPAPPAPALPAPGRATSRPEAGLPSGTTARGSAGRRPAPPRTDDPGPRPPPTPRDQPASKPNPYD